MQTLKGNCLIGQSGGPTAAINASLVGTIEQASASPMIQNIFGSVNGIEGILNNKIIDFSDHITSDEELYLLKHTPSAYLGSCRFKLPSIQQDINVYTRIFEIFEEYNIRYFFYIGGNDSMDTVLKLSEYAKLIHYPINILGVPKTIDNDLAVTDHTPGFGSAAKYIATSMLEISRDSEVYYLESVTIVEIMGRNAGWLTAASVLARTSYNASPDLIYLPEVPFSIDKFIEDIKNIQLHKKSVIVAVSEGIKDEAGQYICAGSSEGCTDGFGHKILGGTAKTLESIVKQKLKCKVRSIELNVLQRCAAHLTSKTDLDEAQEIGKQAVLAGTKGATGKMMTFDRSNGPDYQISYGSIDIREIANVEKKVPLDWINEQGNDVTHEMINYLKPLIQGETQVIYEAGLPVYLTLDTSKLTCSCKSEAV